MSDPANTPVDTRLTLEDSQKLVHELRVHQMELEAQNAEMRQVQERLEVSKAEFVALYDLAPVGYCTVTDTGLITRANLTLATLLGRARSALTSQILLRYILPEDQDLLYHLRKDVLTEGGTQSCEVRLAGDGGKPRWVRLDAVLVYEGSTDLNLTAMDISAFKEMQQVEHRVSDAALQAMSHGVIVSNADRFIVSCNTAFSAIAGYTEAEILGRDCRFLQGPQTDPRTLEAIRTALREHRNFDGEILNYRKDGTPFWNALTISPVLDEQGTLTHYVGVTRNYNETVANRNALAESHAALRRTTELLETTGALAQVGGWEVDLKSMKLSWTHETFSIAGIEPPVEPPLEDGINLFAPETRPAISAAVQAAIDHGTPYDLELPVVDAKGQHKWVRTQGFAELHDGKPIRIYGTFQDITQRRAQQASLAESEAFLRTIVDAVPGMLGYWGVDLTCRFSNSAYEQWLGHTPSEMAGIGMQALLGDALFLENAVYVRGVLGGKNQQIERTLTKVNGEISHTLVHYIAHQRDGEVVGFLALVTDISEIKRAQESLSVSLQEQQALLKEVHHRVKNNLQVIASLLRLEARRSKVPDSVAVLKSMQSRIQTMAQLHESLYRSGTFSSVDLGVYIGRVASQVFQAHQPPGTQVRLKLSMGSLGVSLDQAMPCGLLTHELIANCLKHGFPQGRPGEICVDLQPAEPGTVADEKLWCLRVSDNGVGLPPDFASRREDALGLKLAEDLSHQIGGALHIQSRPEAGAEFSVIFHAQPIAPLVMP
jgi:PAS domain S-box-containing protein